MKDNWISVKDRLPDDDTLVVGIELLEFGDDYKPDAAVFWYLHCDFHLWTDGLEAENYDGGAVIKSIINITHWKYLSEPHK